MPSRIVREEILTSERVERLDWPQEVFYRRLLSKVDDHGLYDARPSLLRSSLYPLRVDKVREADCSRWLAACEMAGLILLYETGGKPYLKVLDTRWQARSEPKYPLPEDGEGKPVQRATVNTCAQPLADVPVVVDVVVVEDVVDKTGARKGSLASKDSHGSRLPADWTLPDDWLAWALKERPEWTDADAGPVAIGFRDYWIAKAGKDARRADWFATWRTWVRNDLRFNPPDKANGKGNGKHAWWESEAGILAKGKELDMAPYGGEGWPEFKARINQRLRAQSGSR